MSYILEPSKRQSKKWKITTPMGRLVFFGQKGYFDFTQHKNEARKMNYINRHAANEDWTDLTKAGTWSRFLLWEKTTLKEAIKNMEKKFNIKIVLKT